MANDNDHWRWAMTVVACLESLRENLKLPISFVDFEVMPPFNGSADGIFVWLIVKHANEVTFFHEKCLEAAAHGLRKSVV